MPDHATSSDPRVQQQLNRLTALGPGADVLGLDRITKLLARVGDPHRALPPTFHVAGTNGKGSTCAFLRAALEASGRSVHVYASPHLVRFNERIRLAGRLIEDAPLAALLEEVLDAGGDIGASFFEVTTAAAFLAFARTPADACVVEVGLGGRLDATNVLAAPVATTIAQLGIDHQSFLGDTAEAIATEKAGIAKSEVPLVTMAYAPSVAEAVRRAAAERGGVLHALGEAWRFEVAGDRLQYSDSHGMLELPLPRLAGPHQPGNFALAVATLRHQRALDVPADALASAARNTRWPARMQRLAPGPLTALLPPSAELWLDGGHNAAAAEAVAGTLARVSAERPVDCVLGMLANKDVPGLLAPLVPHLRCLVAVPTPGHAYHSPETLVEVAQRLGVKHTYAAPDVPTALRLLVAENPHFDTPAITLILGSLYLAGSVLAQNDELPD